MTTLALIGIGEWGSKYIQAAQRIPQCHIKYIKTRDYLDLHTYTDIDGVIIATPDRTHAEIIKSFPDTYLLVEKPFVTSWRDAQTITNTKIMVGHIYLYNVALLHALKDIGRIRHIFFQLCNTQKVSNTTPLWYLAPHGVSLCLSLLGVPENITASEVDGNVIISLIYNKADCIIEIGWNSSHKKRNIIITGDHEVHFADLMEQKVSPLENELRCFIEFIHGAECKTGLDHAKKVTKILDTIQRLLPNQIAP